METKDILKELRTIKGFSSAKDFCEMAGISYNTYQNYETGKRLPTAEILMQLADFYHVSTDYLLGRTPVRAMNTLPVGALSEEEVKDIDAAIVSGYTQLSLESRPCIHCNAGGTVREYLRERRLRRGRAAAGQHGMTVTRGKRQK
ncbi:MAG: helix-turn-helix domain-containing protein [Clostridia bacterium]|nr:helix-turn-helix domain-containing protein [Clostridia bacterium]